MTETFLSRSKSRAVEAFNRVLPWYFLPKWAALVNLSQVRETLRAENLHDTSRIDQGSEHLDSSESVNTSSNGSAELNHADGNGFGQAGSTSSGEQAASASASRSSAARHDSGFHAKGSGSVVLRMRTADGTYNDLEGPHMGAVGQRFGRNVPLDAVGRPGPTELMTPNPRVVSEKLLARTTFLPASTLNILACAWIQFMTRDWFSHGENDAADPYEVSLENGDVWPEHPMKVRRTRKDASRCPMSSGPPTFTNDVTHWWDASQVYGSSAEHQAKLRTNEGGKLRLDKEQRLLTDTDTGAELTGFITDTNWAPLTLLHTLFAREHNAICDALAHAYPSWGDEELFGHARLINAALLAKIHTVEWTPALLTNPTLTAAMYANWWGVLGETVKKQLDRVVDSEVFCGIPGGSKNHFGVPYTITEEFVSVYRLHSLVPDDYTLYGLTNQAVVAQVTLPDLLGKGGADLISHVGIDNMWYSFGIANPGALRLHNFPNHLRTLARHDGELVDLATIDVLRDRERGVPRYNKFRELLHLPKAKSFADLTDNPTWARELEDVYGDIEQLDLLPGVLAEKLPPGMAFGDTQFRVFVLMASRRLNSDRFFTTDFTKEVYTALGLDWVRDNTMRDVLLRHYPALAPALAHSKNAFAPWNPVQL